MLWLLLRLWSCLCYDSDGEIESCHHDLISGSSTLPLGSLTHPSYANRHLPAEQQYTALWSDRGVSSLSQSSGFLFTGLFATMFAFLMTPNRVSYPLYRSQSIFIFYTLWNLPSILYTLLLLSLGYVCWQREYIWYSQSGVYPLDKFQSSKPSRVCFNMVGRSFSQRPVLRCQIVHWERSRAMGTTFLRYKPPFNLTSFMPIIQSVIRAVKNINMTKCLARLLLYAYRSMTDTDYISQEAKTRQVACLKWLLSKHNAAIPEFAMASISETLN